MRKALLAFYGPFFATMLLAFLAGFPAEAQTLDRVERSGAKNVLLLGGETGATPSPTPSLVKWGVARNNSTSTTCAEEDNINIPIYS